MAGFRSRPLRGISAEREPFSERLSRPKNSSVTPKRTTKNGTENMPPEDENVRVNVPPGRVDGVSGSPAKMVAKSSRPPRPPRSAKRKLGLECQPESTSSAPPDRTANDTGVKVIIRMRPMKEDENEVTQIVQILPPNTVMVVDQQFTFDAVANVDSTQKDIFEMVGLPLVENCMEGFNSSIFAYGQTGSGKTYTMWGPTYDSSGDQFPNKDRGLTPRVFEQLFARIEEEEAKNIDKQLRYQCRCSFLEIYNEQITDLLEPNRRNLLIREDTKTGVYVENLTEEYVSSVADVKQLALRGLANRRVGITSMNAESSRSHSVFTCVLESRCKCTSSGLSSLRTSRINLVDLAGSERQKLTGAAGERLKEAGNINRSLSQLGNLIKILAEVSQTGKQRHIPYRDSRLTFLLQESLGGNAKLAMICAISPAASCRSETLSTLRFSQRAKAIQNKAVVNEETENDVNLLRDQIRQLKDELMRMKSKDNNQPTNNGGYSTGWNARRSYNLLRLSLCRPLTLPHTDTDSDEEMEIDEDAVEALSSVTTILSTIDEESTKDSRTSSSCEKEEIQNDLDGFNRENNSASTKIEPNNVYPSIIDLAVESKEPTIELSLARDVNMEENQIGTNVSGQIQDVHFEACETAEIQAVSKSSQQASKEISLLTPSMEHSESTKGVSGASDVKQLPQLAISEIHSSVQTDHGVLIDGIESQPHKSLSTCDLVDIKDETSVTESLENSCNDKTESACDVSGSENGSLHNIPNVLSPTLSIVPSPSSPILQSPPLSVSPRIQEGRRSVNKSFCKSTLSPPNEDRNSGLGSEMLNLSFAQSVRKSTHPLSNKSGNSRTDKLAASLQRGLQVLDIHQQNSALRKSSVRFSFQTLNLKTPPQLLDKVDKSVQTSPKKESSAATSLITELRSSCGRLDIIEANSFKDKEDMQDKSQWQLMPLEKSRGSKGHRHELSQAVEGVLAGSIRREMALEEVCNKQATEIEHLNRLVRQYKHERECNSIIQQAREEKISRLEALVDGTISTEEYLKDELALLAFEHKLLEDKFQNHPEVTRAMIEEKRLSEELEKYRSFCELGERDALMEEIKNLRTQLQYYLDLNSSVSAKKLRLSVVNQSIQRPQFKESAHSLGLCTISELPVAPLDETRDTLSDKKWEEENRQWTERENEWISLVDDLRAELDSVNRLAEKRNQEVENEKRCSEELKEALQMAMEGHARILDQYAELQEKYMSLRAKHRKIREGVADARQAAVMAGIRGVALSLIESQAAELAAMKLDNEQECKALKDEIDGLQAQFRDTVEAVQAAGELVVRLKVAEEAVSIVQDAASRVDQDAEALRRDMQKLKRRHATEIATLNQRLLESRLQKSSVCPMCQVAERVKFEFPDADNATLEAASINSTEAQEEWREELQQQFLPEFQEHDELLRADQPSWFSGHDKCNI